jgi:hypothetical protein
MYVKIKDGAIERYPYTGTDLIRDNPDTSFPRGPLPDDLLAEWGVLPVQASMPPTFNPLTEKLVEQLPILYGTSWMQQWIIEPLSSQEAAAAQAQLLSQYTAALDAHLDAVAQQRRYDNRITCAVRAGYPGPFQAEGSAFAAWMDSCNAQGYQLLASVLAGTTPLPTVEAFIAGLPPMVWPAA